MLKYESIKVGEKYKPTQTFLKEMGREYVGATFTCIEKLGRQRVQFNVQLPDKRERTEIFGHLWAELEPLSENHKQEAVLAKIKYLDDRFKQRKQQNERASVGLGNNNLQQGESVRYHEQGYSVGNTEQTLAYIRQLQYDLYREQFQ